MMVKYHLYIYNINVSLQIIRKEKNMNIGIKIKKLRQRDNITQEDLADSLGVSAQAISRWETSVTSPDITLLPVIANYFEITIDDLMGMDQFKDIKMLNETYFIINKLESEGEYTEAIKILRDKIKVYPNNYSLMSELALALSIKNNDMCDFNEAIMLSEKVLDKSTNEKVISTTKANLCHLYLKVNEYEKASKLIKSLPHIWECRETLLPELYEGEDYSLQLKKSISIIINVISNKIKKIEGGHYSIDDIFALGINDDLEDETMKNAEKIYNFLLTK